MLFAVFALLMPSKLCFHSSLLACKAERKKKPLYLAAAITLLPLQGPAHQKQSFYSLGSRPIARSPSCDVSRVRCLPPLERQGRSCGPGLPNWLPVLRSGVHAEARPVPTEHLPGPVPAAAPQEGAHAAQVHRGRHVSRRSRRIDRRVMNAGTTCAGDESVFPNRECHVLRHVVRLCGCVGLKVVSRMWNKLATPHITRWVKQQQLLYVYMDRNNRN